VNPEPFLQLDRVIHEKGRLTIMSLLAASPELSFTENPRHPRHDRRQFDDAHPHFAGGGLRFGGEIVQEKPSADHLHADGTGPEGVTAYINLLEAIVQQTKPK